MNKQLKNITMNINLKKILIITICIITLIILTMHNFVYATQLESQNQVIYESIPEVVQYVDGEIKIKEVREDLVNDDLKKKNKEIEKQFEKDEQIRRIKELVILIIVVIVLAGAILIIIKPIDPKKMSKYFSNNKKEKKINKPKLNKTKK